MIRILNSEYFEYETVPTLRNPNCEGVTRFKAKGIESKKERVITTVLHEKSDLNEDYTKIKVIPDPKDETKNLVRISQKSGLSYDTDVWLVAIPYNRKATLIAPKPTKGVSFYKATAANSNIPSDRIFYFVVVPDTRLLGKGDKMLEFSIKFASKIDDKPNMMMVDCFDFQFTNSDETGRLSELKYGLLKEEVAVEEIHNLDADNKLPIMRPKSRITEKKSNENKTKTRETSERKPNKKKKTENSYHRAFKKDNIPQVVAEPPKPPHPMDKRFLVEPQNNSESKENGNEREAFIKDPVKKEDMIHMNTKSPKLSFQPEKRHYDKQLQDDSDNSNAGEDKPKKDTSKPIRSQKDLDSMIQKAFSEGKEISNWCINNRSKKKNKKNRR